MPRRSHRSASSRMWVVRSDGDTFLVPKLAEVVGEVATRPGVEAGGRFVQQEHVRPVQQRLGQFHPPSQSPPESVSTRSRARSPTPRRESMRLRPAVEADATEAVQVAVVQEILHHRELGIQARMLEDHPQMASDVVRLAGHVVVEDGDASAGGEEQRGQNLEEGRLAAAVGSEKAEDLTARDRERDARQRLTRSVAMTKILDHHGGVACSARFETAPGLHLFGGHPSLVCILQRLPSAAMSVHARHCNTGRR